MKGDRSLWKANRIHRETWYRSKTVVTEQTWTFLTSCQHVVTPKHKWMTSLAGELLPPCGSQSHEAISECPLKILFAEWATAQTVYRGLQYPRQQPVSWVCVVEINEKWSNEMNPIQYFYLHNNRPKKNVLCFTSFILANSAFKRINIMQS